MDFIADTNVWYDIAAGRRNAEKLKAGGHRLLATPVSLLEIVSLIDNDFKQRRAAAHAVVEHADLVSVDSESHIARGTCRTPHLP
jgi:predicted nucleic acid-binding protein